MATRGTQIRELWERKLWMVISLSYFSNLNWQWRECISSVMSRRACLDFRDELLSGVSISLALSSGECKWSASGVQWSAVVYVGLRIRPVAAEACRSERDCDPWWSPSDMFVVHD